MFGYVVTSGMPAEIAAFAGVLLLAFAISFLVFFVYAAIVLMVIAKKTGTPGRWMAWVPIANFYLMAQIGGVPWWTLFAFLLFLIPFFGPAAFMGVVVWWWWKIAERRNFPGWYGILMLLPVVNLVVMGIMAWGSK